MGVGICGSFEGGYMGLGLLQGSLFYVASGRHAGFSAVGRQLTESLQRRFRD